MNIKAFQGDALNLSNIEDNTYDITLVLGPLYHLYNDEDINNAIKEAIRVTKKDGVIDKEEFVNKYNHTLKPLTVVQDIIHNNKLDIEDLAHQMKSFQNRSP